MFGDWRWNSFRSHREIELLVSTLSGYAWFAYIDFNTALWMVLTASSFFNRSVQSNATAYLTQGLSFGLFYRLLMLKEMF